MFRFVVADRFGETYFRFTRSRGRSLPSSKYKSRARNTREAAPRRIGKQHRARSRHQTRNSSQKHKSNPSECTFPGRSFAAAIAARVTLCMSRNMCRSILERLPNFAPGEQRLAIATDAISFRDNLIIDTFGNAARRWRDT